jgi:hypothetical protein
LSFIAALEALRHPKSLFTLGFGLGVQLKEISPYP